MLHRVLLERGDEIEGVLDGDAALGERLADGFGFGQAGILAAVQQGVGEGIEPRGLFIGAQRRIIRDVVDGAGIGIKHRHMGPQFAGNEERPHREVLVPCPLAGRGFQRCTILIHGAFDTTPGLGLQRRAKFSRSTT